MKIKIENHQGTQTVYLEIPNRIFVSENLRRTA